MKNLEKKIKLKIAKMYTFAFKIAISKGLIIQEISVVKIRIDKSHNSNLLNLTLNRIK
jgi:hypothetical protein